MTNKGVTQILAERYTTSSRAGSKIECPFCSHKTFSIRKDDLLGKCFHPSCGRFITSGTGTGSEIGAWQPVLERVERDFHIALLAQANDPGRSAYRYIAEYRHIHPRVIEDSLLGVVPDGYDLEAVLCEVDANAQNGKQAEEVKEAQNKLRNCVNGHAGWLCFFYTDEYHRIVAIKFRQPYSKNFLHFKSFEPAGLFGHGLFKPDPALTESGLVNHLIVVEGEVNQLQLQSLLVRYCEATGQDWDYVHACAVGGVNSADFKTLSRIASRPIICFDHDSSGAGFQLVEKAREHLGVSAFTTPEPDSDLDEFVRSFGDRHADAWEALKSLVAEAKSYSMHFEPVAQQIFELRSAKGKPHAINKQVSDRIRNDMSQRGTFHWNEQGAYFQDITTRQLIRVDSHCREYAMYLDNYGLNPTDKIYPYVVEDLAIKASKLGTRSNIYHLAHYEPKNQTVHLYKHDNSTVRITPRGYDIVANGTDGILFLSDRNAAPFNIGRPDPSSSLFRDLILNKINFAADHLTVGECRWLFSTWFYTLFFDSIMRTRPILTMLGEQGSGKSSSLRWLGMLLFGSHFDVTPLPHKCDDFDAAITNSDFVAIDNADSRCPWLEDRMAIVATGGELKRRILYTTNDLVGHPVRCALAVTSRTPRFRRPDVAQRLLVLKLAAISPLQFQSESELVREVAENRDLIMTEGVGNIQEILQALEAQEGYHGTGGLRMADFGNFAMKIARHTGTEEAAEAMLQKLTTGQSTFTLEDDIVFELLPLWVDNNPGREITYGELCDELSKLASSKGVDFIYRGQHKSFAQRMRNLKTALGQFFVISERPARAGKVYYRFRPKNSSDGDAISDSPSHPTNPSHPELLLQVHEDQSVTG